MRCNIARPTLAMNRFFSRRWRQRSWHATALPGPEQQLLPALDEEEPWFDAARRLRAGLDYVRVLEPRYAASPKLRVRTEERAPRVVRWMSALSPPLCCPPAAIVPEAPDGDARAGLGA